MTNASNIKQVIVMRKDLNMRNGKMVSQGAHASLKVILDMMYNRETPSNVYKKELFLTINSPITRWLEGDFTKIVVGVGSEEELLSIYSDVLSSNIPVALITDNGHTEFAGVLTNTCLCMGPWWSDDIDKITGRLKLL